MKAFQMKFVELSEALLRGFYDKIMDIEPKDGGGMWLWPESGDPNQLIKELAPLLKEAQWFVSSKKDKMFFIEPLVTKPVVWQPFAFHVSDVSNRESIDQNGLEAREGGNTAMERSYPARVHLSFDVISAFQFVDYQCRENADRVSKAPEDFDIWKVAVPEDFQLRKDALFPGRACWVLDSLPRANLELLEDWQSLYKSFRDKGFF